MSTTKAPDPIRRRLTARLLMGALVAPLTLFRSQGARAAGLPLLNPSSPAAARQGSGSAPQAARLFDIGRNSIETPGPTG